VCWSSSKGKMTVSSYWRIGPPYGLVLPCPAPLSAGKEVERFLRKRL